MIICSVTCMRAKDFFFFFFFFFYFFLFATKHSVFKIFKRVGGRIQR